MLSPGWQFNRNKRNNRVELKGIQVYKDAREDVEVYNNLNGQPVYNLQHYIQGDHSGCAKSPVNTKTKVLF